MAAVITSEAMADASLKSSHSSDGHHGPSTWIRETRACTSRVPNIMSEAGSLQKRETVKVGILRKVSRRLNATFDSGLQQQLVCNKRSRVLFAGTHIASNEKYRVLPLSAGDLSHCTSTLAGIAIIAPAPHPPRLKQLSTPASRAREQPQT